MLCTGDTAMKKKLGENVRQREENNLMTVLMRAALNARKEPRRCTGISPWGKVRRNGCQIINREDLLEKLASEPTPKVARQRRVKWGGEVLLRGKHGTHVCNARKWKIQGPVANVMQEKSGT